MRDQAFGLRNLIQQTERGSPTITARLPQLIVVAAAKGGVGITTVAINLAAAMARQGRRVVLVDADSRGGNVAELCGVDEAAEGARWDADVQQFVIPGPTGLQIVCPQAAGQDTDGAHSHERQHFVRQLKTLGRLGEFIVMDGGIRPSTMMRSLWTTAHRVLLVTTPDALAVMDTYALIKTTLDSRCCPQILSLVNQSSGDGVAADVQHRLVESCRRFLGQFVTPAGQVPLDKSLTEEKEMRGPAVLQSPTSPAAQAIERLAARLVHESQLQQKAA